MKVTAVTTYRGPNLFTGVATIRLRLQFGALSGWSTDRLLPLIDDIVALLPGIADDLGDDGQPGGLVAGFRQPPGKPVTRLMARVALELQRLAGADVHVWGDTPTGDPAVRDVLFAYEDDEVGHGAGQAALAMIAALLPAELTDFGDPAQADAGALRDDFVQWARARALDQTTRAIVNAARKRGIPWFRIDPSARFVQLGHGVNLRRLRETLLADAPATGLIIAFDKATTNRLLYDNGIPVARQLTVDTSEAAVAAAQAIGYPVVVKPVHGHKGDAVAVHLTTDDAVRTAAAAALKVSEGAVVERFIPGDDFRLLVVGGRMIAAARRIPGRIVGDGRQTVDALVDALNRDPRRGVGFAGLMNRIAWDAQAEAMLREQGLTRQSIPADGRIVALRRTANISTGGTAVDVTAQVHRDNQRLAERAAALCGLPVAGIDVLSEDISRSYRDTGIAVCEVNASPGLRPHWIANPRQDLVGPILDVVYPDGGQGRIPIAAIAGTNGKTTTAVMVSHILRHAGRVVGRATSDSAWVGNDLLVRGESAGVGGARLILGDRRTEVAVLEVARRGILDRGVGFDACDVAAVTNIDDDHIGDKGINSLDDMARVKRVVASLAREALVLNGDDHRSRAMADAGSARHVWLVSTAAKQAGLVDHLQRGGRVIWLDDAGQIQLHDGTGVQRLMAAGDIPATRGGLVAHNTVNAMFAAAMARALGVGVETIRTALGQFDNTVETNPGRMNVFDRLPFKVIVDYAHNAPGAARMRAIVERLQPTGRRILAFYSNGNRADEKIDLLGRTVAGGFDDYLIYQTKELRGRQPGEVNGILHQALIAAGVAPDKISEWPSETAAVAAALDRARPGDMVVLFSDDYAKTWPQVVAYAPPSTDDAPPQP